MVAKGTAVGWPLARAQPLLVVPSADLAADFPSL
jgi:hypothetical protein